MDGIIVYCFKDPALDACKDKTEYSGCGIAGILHCLGRYYRDYISVITSRKYSVAYYSRVFKDKVGKVTCLGIPVLEFLDYAKVEKALKERVVLGCGFILGVDFSRLKKYGVFIVRPVAAAVVVSATF